MSSQRRRLWIGIAGGLLLTAPLLALLYLGSGLLGLPMVAFDLFERITRVPQLGGLVSKSIDVMVSIFSRLPGVATDTASKSFEQFSALGLFFVLGALAAAICVLWRPWRVGGLAVGLVVWILSLGVEGGNLRGDQLVIDALWFAILYGAWGYALVWFVERMSKPEQPGVVDTGRRKFLIQFGSGAIVLTLGAWASGRLFATGGESSSAGKALASQPAANLPAVSTGTAAATQATTADASFAIVPGTRPEITPNDQFYRVDIEVDSLSAVDEKTWKLSVGGLVNNPFSLSYDELLKLPSVKQYATLECISNPVGGDLISTTQWTGVKLADMLNKAGLKSGVAEIKFTCSDGYTESLPLESAMDERTLLTYAMNDQALPVEHGFPLRLYTPNRYGMKNPKWITTVEAIDTPIDGFWEQRGWDKAAIVKATSVIDATPTTPTSSGVVPVGGIAFAGVRGISKVEVSVDSGPWQAAQLKAPVSPLTWTLWRYDWQATKGQHTLTVRTTDGAGKAQIEDVAPLHPDGASGYYSATVSV